MVATTVDGRFAGAQGSIRDIRERERLEADLRSQAAAIAANEERANLARELHDSVTQALFSMGLTARALELLLDRDPEAAREKLAELRDLQKDALAEMRTLIFELRPQGLETDGLAQALRNHAAAVQGRTGLAVAVEIEMDERLPLHVEEALYRVAQEALHNVVKHANAENARIALRRRPRAAPDRGGRRHRLRPGRRPTRPPGPGGHGSARGTHRGRARDLAPAGGWNAGACDAAARDDGRHARGRNGAMT